MWSEAERSLVPALPLISTAGSGSRSRHSSQSSMVLRNKPHQAENSSRMVSNSVEDFEHRAASSRELDCKVAELFTELSRLRAIVGHLEAERTNQDVWLKESFVHVRDQMFWLSQKVDNTLNTLANKVEQLEQQAATEHAHLLTMAVEQSKKGVWEYSNKMKNSLQEQISSLDKIFQKEHATLISYTTQLEDKLSGQLTSNIQSQLDSLRADIEKERTRYGSQLAGLSSSLSVVGRNCKESKEELSSVISIEIKTRQSEVAKAQSEYQKLHGLCRSSIGSIREGLISLEERLASDKEEAQLLSDKLYQEWHRTNQRMQADVSARLTALHNHINSVSSTHKLAGDSAKEDCESATSPSHVTRTKNDEQGEGKKLMTDVSGQAAVNGTSYDHNMLATEMESLQKEIERQSAQVNKLASSLNNFQVWVVGAMQRETGERCQSDFELTKEISNIRAQLSMVFTALNTPYFNENTQFFELSHSAYHPNPDTHFRKERQVRDLSSNHPPYNGASHKQTAPGLDNVVSDRPTGATTTAFSPFPEGGGERGPYMSNVESETETESDGDAIRHKFSTPATLPESPLLQYQVALLTSSDPLETSLESHSRHSSASELPHLQYNTKEFPLDQRQPEGHTVNKNSQFFHLQHVPDVPETNGSFTSVSATPDSQQKVSVTDKIRQQSDSGEDGGEQREREGPLEQERDLRKNDERKLERKPVGLGSDHVKDKVAEDENSGSEYHTKKGDLTTTK